MNTAAIYFVQDAYTTGGPRLMGRNAAGESFLRGFLAHSPGAAFWGRMDRPEDAAEFMRIIQASGRPEPAGLINLANLEALAPVGTLYYPGPNLGPQAFQRAAHGHGAWSLCGITHTTCSTGAMDALAELVTAPVQPWDALICTSRAVKDNVERLLRAQADYFRDRLGITRMIVPQLPVIPLGVHAQDFVFTDAQKAAARARLEADKDTLVVLFVGRLSFHAKAHPLAMYQALEAAAQQTGKQVVLVECGWHANEFIAKAYADAAAQACPSVRVVTLDGRLAGDRETAWAGAEIFCSLSDNIQETFGITPIEAMAAGLPVVVSDWDGYKDTVRDGVDGFRIPTLMPPPGAGQSLALRHALDLDTYDMYCGYASSFVAVDVPAATKAFCRLFDEPDLRKQMGEAGRQRARSVYDWAAIIPQYHALWGHLAEIRAAQAGNLKPLVQPWPARMDPFYAFASYPTRTLMPETPLGLVDADAATAFGRAQAYLQLTMVDYVQDVLPEISDIQKVLQAAAGGPKPARELVADIPPARQGTVFVGLSWLVKLNILRVGI